MQLQTSLEPQHILACFSRRFSAWCRWMP
jgi:hypothetical protein